MKKELLKKNVETADPEVEATEAAPEEGEDESVEEVQPKKKSKKWFVIGMVAAALAGAGAIAIKSHMDASGYDPEENPDSEESDEDTDESSDEGTDTSNEE